MADLWDKITCPHCNYLWYIKGQTVGDLTLHKFVCVNPFCGKEFVYKKIKGRWRLFKPKPKLEEVESWGGFDL